MKIEYNDVNFDGRDAIHIRYSVLISHDDDIAHYPAYRYDGRFLLRGDDASKSDDEIYEMVVNHMEENLKHCYGCTIEEMESDPWFAGITISVSKEQSLGKEIKITK